MPRLRPRILFAILVIATSALPALTQANPALFNVRKVYVEKMENNLDQYITSEISGQFHGSLEVVLDPKPTGSSKASTSARRTPPSDDPAR